MEFTSSLRHVKAGATLKEQEAVNPQTKLRTFVGRDGVTPLLTSLEVSGWTLFSQTQQRGRPGAELIPEGHCIFCLADFEPREQEMERLRSDNLDLKLRVQYLEELSGDRRSSAPSFWDARATLSAEQNRLLEGAMLEVQSRDEQLAQQRESLSRAQAALEESMSEKLAISMSFQPTPYDHSRFHL